MEGLNINALVLVAQVIISGFLLYISFRKAPVERQSYDASTAAQYAQAAKLKQEENDKLESYNDRLEAEMEDLRKSIARKRYRVTVEFTIGDRPEPGKVTVEPILDAPVEQITKPTPRRKNVG